MPEPDFGPYRLERLLGRGGMGEVWLAFDTRLNRTIALKILPEHLAADPEFRARFVRESQIVAKLNEPHIIPIHQAGEIDGRLFIDMRLVEGQDLAVTIERSGPMEPSRAVEIIGQVASALDAAHASGILHRDIKPSNILLAGSTADGQPDFAYLVDFGIAHFSAGDTSITATGAAVGTLAYMAPERFSEGSADHRSDVYSLACVLFQCLTGIPPFRGESLPALLHAHLNLPAPRASSHRPGIPAGLDDVIAVGLAKNPDRRQSSAGRFAADARQALSSLTLPDASPAAPVLREPPALAEHEALTLSLVNGFRFVHEPLSYKDDYIPSLGHEELVQAVCDRIRRSSGGALLLCGFRGTGKTTVVNHSLERLVEQDETARRYVTIKLSLARPIGSNELLFAIVRRLFEELVDKGLLDQIPPNTRNSIVLAYVRTSMSLADKRSEGRESTRTAGLSAKLAVVPGLQSLTPKLERSTKTSRSIATEASFLAYSDSDVEHDFLRIIQLLRSVRSPTTFRDRLLGRRPAPPIHVVVVLDELDKLTVAPGGEQSLETMIGVLKNIFSTSGVHTLFVGGVDILDRVLKDYHHGLGLFESVFAWTVYVPCLWDGPDRLLKKVIARDQDPEMLDDIHHYLRFKGRGLTRRLFQSFNDMVRFDESVPRVAVGRLEREAFGLYAKLSRLLDAYLGEHAGERYSSLDDDRFRLGVYHVVDWLLRTEGAIFTAEDVISGERSISPLLRQSERRVESLLRFLAQRGLLERMSSEPNKRTIISNLPQTKAARYRVGKELRGELARIYRLNEHERQGCVEENDEDVGGKPTDGRDPQAAKHDDAADVNQNVPHGFRFLSNGRYELLDVLGSGSVSTVYVARNTATGQQVAARLLNGTADGPEQQALRARFVRQALLATKLDHPGVVRTHELVEEANGVVATITDLVRGVGLAASIEAGLSATEAVQITASILDVLEYLHTVGLVRLDLKPTNFVLLARLKPVLTDMTLARPIQEFNNGFSTSSGVLLGTPFYMAPKQLDPSREVDGRADIHAVGVILYEILLKPSERARLRELAPRHLGKVWDTSVLDVSPELREVVSRALAVEPDDRFPTAAGFRYQLDLVPEGYPVVPEDLTVQERSSDTTVVRTPQKQR